jgi:hypothetical protein
LGHSSFHAINAIVDEAADATAARVAVNATIANEAAHAVAGRASGISSSGSMSRSSPTHTEEKHVFGFKIIVAQNPHPFPSATSLLPTDGRNSHQTSSDS